eukprot:gene26597-18379_t
MRGDLGAPAVLTTCHVVPRPPRMGPNRSQFPVSDLWSDMLRMPGLGSGVIFDYEIAIAPTSVASTDILDRRTPSQEICNAYGYSAMTLDQRLFVSFNPFNVYITQPVVKPGCVLRPSNVKQLEDRKLVNSAQVDECRRNLNTFAYVGDLGDSPEVACVYHSEEAENRYINNQKEFEGIIPLPSSGKDVDGPATPPS